MQIKVSKPSDILHLSDKRVGFDIETTGFKLGTHNNQKTEVTVVQIYDPVADIAHVIPIHTREGKLPVEEWSVLQSILPTLLAVGHNLQFDIGLIHQTFGVSPKIVGDTFIISRMLQMLNQGLKDIAISIWPQLTEKLVKFGDMLDYNNEIIPDDYSVKNVTQLQYFGYDAYLPYKIEQHFQSLNFWPKYANIYQIEIDFLDVTAHHRVKGVQIDINSYNKMVPLLSQQVSEMTEKLYEQIGRPVKINSPKDLQKALFDELELTPKIMTKGGKSGIKNPSTNEEALTALIDDHPCIDTLIKVKHTDNIYRSILKLPEYLDDNNLVYPTIEQIGFDGTSRIYCVTGDTIVNIDGIDQPIFEAELKHNLGMIQTQQGPEQMTYVGCSGVSKVYTVSLADGKKVTCTGDHPIAVLRQNKSVWVLAQDLKEGDEVIVQ